MTQKFYEVEVNGVVYKTQGYSEDDAKEQILEHDVNGPWGSYKSLESTLDDDADIRVRRIR